MINKSLYFDYSACLILGLLILTTILRNMLKGKANKYFFGLIIITFVSTIFDIWAVTMDNMVSTAIALRYISHTGYLITHCLTVPFYALYLFVLTDTLYKIKKKRILFYATFVPLALTLLIVLANFWTKNIFYINDDYEYVRGPLMILLYLCAGVYTVYGIIYLIVFHRKLKTRRFISSLCVFPILGLAMVVQFYKPYVLLEMFGLASSLLFISLMVHRPEDEIETVTGLRKMTVYMSDMKNNLANGKSIRILMLNISNYPTIRELLGYNTNLNIMKQIAVKLDSLNKSRKLDADLYYLGRGKFRAVVTEKKFDILDKAADFLNEAMKNNFVVNEMSVNLVTQVCITKFPEDIDDVDALMSFGDMLNNVPYTGNVHYASELLDNIHYDIMSDIDAIIDDALANNGFEVYYQPIYSVEENKFTSAEALIRLKDKKYGFISPELFIPASERSGSIHKIGDFVLNEVCRFMASEEYKSLMLKYVEVNLSVSQCMQSSLAENIISTMKNYNISHEQINFEITETAISVSQQAFNKNINTLTEAGIKISLDDFGTGYSNMQRVASLPLEIVKLDKSFTELENNPKLMIMLRNTVNMLKDMDMKIVAEGIETEEMAKRFSDMKCEYIQGYYYSRPVPKHEFVSFIKKSMQA